MENVGIKSLFGNIYKDRRVLITGHTGFKGSWLALWLERLGAKIAGYSLSPPTQPNHYDLLNLPCDSIIGDIRDIEKLKQAFSRFEPEIVFHLAAQPLVRYSYKEPKETFEVNVIGTVNVSDVCRITPSVKAIVNITSDKCYENKEWVWGYRENDPMGGYDPYSASKGCSELVTNAYRNSFFHPEQYGKTHHILVASARAGNVIGGGDWGADRLVPDIMRSAAKGEKVLIRSPHAIRPWQHVLEPLSGYLLLGQKLLEGKTEFSGAWNFGPCSDDHHQVITVVKNMQNFWDKIDFSIISDDEEKPHEANLLKLDCSKAYIRLGWKPVWNSFTAFEKTAIWYRNFYDVSNIISCQNLSEYIDSAE